MPTSELLDMDGAIERLQTTRSTFYRWLQSGRLKGLRVGHKWRFKADDLDRFMSGEGPGVEFSGNIMPLLEILAERLAVLGGKEPREEESPVMHAVMLMTLLGQKMRASDFTIEPGHKLASLRYRLDGVLHRVAEFETRLLPAIIDQWKMLANCNAQEKSRPQDGRIVFEPPQTPERLDMRLCFLPAVGGESLTVRLLMASSATAGFDIAKLELSPSDEARLSAALERPSGLIIVTGPTGTGKTTTLYSCVQRLVGAERKIVTIEDPVEYVFDGVTQVPVKSDAGMTFPAAFRAALRSNADVIMCGEVRDGETAMLCFQGAMTGHTVLTALHTNDAASAVTRMIDVGVPAHVAADALTAIVGQRLARRLCPHCSKAHNPPQPLLDQAMEIAKSGGIDWVGLQPKFRSAAGCAKCNMTGYQGRVLLAEVMTVTPEIASAIRRGATGDELRVIAIREGMTTMAADGIRKAAAGITTIEEVLRTAPQ